MIDWGGTIIGCLAVGTSLIPLSFVVKGVKSKLSPKKSPIYWETANEDIWMAFFLGTPLFCTGIWALWMSGVFT